MANEKIISGNTEAEVWQQLNKDLYDGNLLEYEALISQGNLKIALNIDVDMGGGFEGGLAETSLISPVSLADDFRFAIHREHFTDEIGKFFGMQDVVIGYKDFDNKVVVKTNKESKVKDLFADEFVRHTFQSLKDDFTFGITSQSHEKVLEYITESGLNDPAELRKIYNAFIIVLTNLIQLPD